MIFPLSHRERGNEGERPVNQTKQNLLVDGMPFRELGAKDPKEHKVKHKVTQRKSQRINFLSDIT